MRKTTDWLEPRESDATARRAAHDPSAFRAFYEAHQALVFNVCFRMLAHRQEAEDLTQEVFLKAFQSLDQLRGESKVSTWLYRIALNRCLNHLRRKRRERWLSLDFLFPTDEGDSTAQPAATEDNPREALQQRELETGVQAAIRSLPDAQRAALVLHVYERLSYAEIAVVMRCSVASVESRLHRAKQNLARRLASLWKQ